MKKKPEQHQSTEDEIGGFLNLFLEEALAPLKGVEKKADAAPKPKAIPTHRKRPRKS